MKKPRSLYPDDSSRMSLKQRRNYYRSSIAAIPFHEGTNRIVRERIGWTTRNSTNSGLSYGDHRYGHASPLRFNGRLPSYYYESGSDTSSDTSSDTVSTLSLVDWDDEEVDSDADELSEYMDMMVSSHD